MANSNSSTNNEINFNNTKSTYTAGLCIQTESSSKIKLLENGLSHEDAIRTAELAADSAEAEGEIVFYVSAYRDQD